MLRKPALWLCLVVFVFSPAFSDEDRPSRVIFFGNSFTYYNESLHFHYSELLKSEKPTVQVHARASTISGSYLREHGGLPFLVKAEPWDAVVMQDYSRGPIDDFEGFRSAVKKFSKIIRKENASPVLFMTWAYTDAPEMTEQLEEAYSRVGAEFDILVAPVGLAFADVTRERPDIRLRVDDRKHPTPEGTYLAACVFYTVLHRRSPVGLTYDAGLEKETVAYLQGVALKTVTGYFGE